MCIYLFCINNDVAPKLLNCQETITTKEIVFYYANFSTDPRSVDHSYTLTGGLLYPNHTVRNPHLEVGVNPEFSYSIHASSSFCSRCKLCSVLVNKISTESARSFQGEVNTSIGPLNIHGAPRVFKDVGRDHFLGRRRRRLTNPQTEDLEYPGRRIRFDIIYI